MLMLVVGFAIEIQIYTLAFASVKLKKKREKKILVKTFPVVYLLIRMKWVREMVVPSRESTVQKGSISYQYANSFNILHALPSLNQKQNKKVEI